MGEFFDGVFSLVNIILGRIFSYKDIFYENTLLWCYIDLEPYIYMYTHKCITNTNADYRTETRYTLS